MPVLSLACHLPHNAPHIAWPYNYEQTTKQTKAINNSYIYINISCKCDTNRAGHLTLDAYASRPVACVQIVSASPTLLLNAILATWAQFCKDCYIISTCTPSCPATGTAWLWWLAWAGAWLCCPLMWLSIYNKEWDTTIIQPISSTLTSELFKKAFVDIWIDLYLIKFQFLAFLCVFVFLSLEEFFITGVQSCPY